MVGIFNEEHRSRKVTANVHYFMPFIVFYSDVCSCHRSMFFFFHGDSQTLEDRETNLRIVVF